MAIKQFKGKYRFLSNFYKSSFQYKGIVWPTSEHAYQAMKSEDPERWEEVQQANGPHESKKMGRKTDLRGDWEEVKTDVMREVIEAKFRQNDELKQKLLDTHPEKLIEGNHWGDSLWGVTENGNGEGENHLGRILMELREELMEEAK
jgi:ribA/ribD-fused uncharacterized protein